jgi:hypothetical protein
MPPSTNSSVPLTKLLSSEGEEYRRFGKLFHPANTSEWNEAAEVSHEPFAVLGRHRFGSNAVAESSAGFLW